MTRAQLIAYITGILALAGTLVGLSLWTGSIDPETGYPEPITVDGKTIEFTWTDDNTNEDLIIYTDQATYTNGLSHAEVYVALHNNSGVKQNVSFGGYFRDSSKQIAELSVLLEVTEELSETVQVEDCKNRRDYTITATGTEICNKFKEQTNTWQETSLRWVPLPQEERNELVDAVNLSKTGRQDKTVEGFIADKVANYEMEIGEVVYFKALVKFPPNSDDNFYFKAIGSEGSLGWLDPWWNSSWTYRVRVEVNPSYVDSDLTNYPLYIDLADMPSTFKDNILTDGADIRVVESDDTTETPFEVVSASTTASVGELYALVDTLSSSATTTLYIYYGNAGASAYASSTTYGSQNVWTDYAFVSHDGSGEEDSSGNINLTANGGVSTGGVAGKIGDATFYDGSDDYYSTTDDGAVTVTGDNPITHSAWINRDGAQTRFSGIYSHSADRVLLQYQNVGGTNLLYGANTTGGYKITAEVATADATWEQYVGINSTSDNTMKLYKNGTVASEPSVTSNTIVTTSGTAFIGSQNGTTRDFNGMLDELRIRKSELSANWIDAEYTNFNTPTPFYYVGAEETDSGGGEEAPQSTVIIFE